MVSFPVIPNSFNFKCHLFILDFSFLHGSLRMYAAFLSFIPRYNKQSPLILSLSKGNKYLQFNDYCSPIIIMKINKMTYVHMSTIHHTLCKLANCQQMSPISHLYLSQRQVQLVRWFSWSVHAVSDC